MKRTLVNLLSLLALFTITSCQKEATGDGSQFRATMEPTADGKTVLSGMALNWVSGDRVAIYGTAGRGLYAATPQTPATVATLDNVSGETGNGPFRAFYPSSLTDDGTTITLPSAQTYVEGSINEFPMYAESATNQLAFKNLCGVLKLHLTKSNTNITTITVKANAEINGQFTVSYVNDVPYLSYVQGGSNTVTMTCPTAQDISNGKDFYIALPATFDSLKSIELNTADGRYCVKTVKSNVCINVQRSEVTEIEFGESDMNFVEPLPEGALPGLFTINPNGDQIRFSQGNLQYQASTDTWRFAGNQWDYVGTQTADHNGCYGGNVEGSDNSYISTTYSGWIDLFRFRWSTGNTFVDWGAQAISNGGGVPNMWRTMSNSEWDYLINLRADAFSKKATGCVNGVHGLILLPDCWTIPEGCTFNEGSSNTHGLYGYYNNVYTISEWILMEAAGAIFLPAAGYLYGTFTQTRAFDVARIGYYWSSMPDGSYRAYLMRFYNFGDYISTDNRQYGCSVRLVRDYN